MTKTKETLAKLLLPLSSNLSKSLTISRKNKVSPIGATANQNEFLLLRDTSDRRDGEYLQARRALLSSYHLINGGDRSFKNKMKGLYRDVKTRVGVRVYRFTVACPWTGTGKVLVFRCFLPHLKT